MAEVIGAEQVLRAFERLGANAVRKIDRQVLRQAAKEVQVEARKNAPARSGALRKSLKVRAGRRSRTTQSVLVISKEKYARFVEFGTKRNEAEKYLTRALEAKRGNIEQRFREALRQAIANL